MHPEDFVVDDLTFRVRSGHEANGPSSPAARPAEPTYVLIHGIGTSHRYLERLRVRLEGDARVYTVDLPGFGGVPKPAFSPSVASVARALGVILNDLGIRDAVLVGHSMGAQWVVETAVAHPGLARAVVIVGPVVDDRRRTFIGQSMALARDMAVEPAPANAVVLIDYLRCGPVWFLRQTRRMLEYPIEARVPLLTVPLFIVRGGGDPIARLAWCRRLCERAPSGRLVVIPGHHHNAHFSSPRAVASAIDSFVRGIR